MPKVQQIGKSSAVALVVGSIVGTGIFVTPIYVARFSAAWGTTLLLWGLGALLCFIGGDIYGRLGEKFPKAGGPYVYLYEAFGRPLSLTYGWMSLLIISPSMIASYSMFFGEQLKIIAPAISNSEVKVAALSFSAVMTLINCLGIRPATVFERLIVILQLGLILSLFVALTYHFSWHFGMNEPVSQGLNFSLLASAIAGILWSFEGFNCLSFVAHEIQDAKHNLRLSILWGVFIVFIVYALVNVMALVFLDYDQLVSAENIASLLAMKVFGSGGIRFTSLLMLVAVTMSCLPAILIGPRVTYEMAVNGFLPRFFSALASRGKAPYGGLWIQYLCTSFFILVGNFEWLMASFVTVTWIFYMLIGIAFFKLVGRHEHSRFSRRRDLIQVIIFSSLACVVVALQFQRDFHFSIVGVALTLILFGILHFIFRRQRT